MSPERESKLRENLIAALDLFEAGVDLYVARLLREHPDLGEEERGALLEAWLLARPGAERGDWEAPPRRARTEEAAP